jgi:hypothetical protein
MHINFTVEGRTYNDSLESWTVIDLGSEWNTELSLFEEWGTSDPDSMIKNETWHTGAIIYDSEKKDHAVCSDSG